MKWRRSEGGVVGRFGDPRKALKPSILVMGDAEADPTRTAFIVDSGNRLDQLNLKLAPVVDWTTLSSLQEENKDALSLAVILRDPALKRYTLLGNWAATDLPESIPFEGEPAFERMVQDRMSLSVTLAFTRPVADMEPGITLARKDFVILTDRVGTQFPHQFVDPDYFTKIGLPRSTGWYVHIFDFDGDKPSEDTFVVCINKEIAAMSSAKGADAMWASLAADTMAALLIRLLRTETPEEPVEGSILAQLQRQVSQQGVSLAEVGRWVREGETAKVGSLCQCVIKMNQILKGAL